MSLTKLYTIAEIPFNKLPRRFCLLLLPGTQFLSLRLSVTEIKLCLGGGLFFWTRIFYMALCLHPMRWQDASLLGEVAGGSEKQPAGSTKAIKEIKSGRK